MKKISKQILLNNGFTYIDKTCNEYLGNSWDEYVIDVDSLYAISVKDISNMIDRNWNVHIDNKNYETIASVDIDTVEHFNMLMKLMDINFKLKEE